jgi:hypothetical protein
MWRVRGHGRFDGICRRDSGHRSIDDRGRNIDECSAAGVDRRHDHDRRHNDDGRHDYNHHCHHDHSGAADGSRSGAGLVLP